MGCSKPHLDAPWVVLNPNAADRSMRLAARDHTPSDAVVAGPSCSASECEGAGESWP